MLVYGAVKSPLAQPRNVLGGHVLSALVGVACQQLFGAVPWLAALACDGLNAGVDNSRGP